MIHLKNMCLVVLIMINFIRCTEIYQPILDSKADALIVEGLITDGTGPFTVNLTKSVLFNSDSTSLINNEKGAMLTVTDNENNTFELTETGSGKYTLPISFKAKTGNSYKLHIQTTDGSIYESNIQKLLPPQSYDSIHGSYTTEGYIDMNNVYKKVGGANIQEDLFKSVSMSDSDSFPTCRFNSNITVQYLYTLYMLSQTDWHWVYFGWVSFPFNNVENITDEKSLSSNTIIKNHSLGFMPFETSSYGFSTPGSTSVIYYLRVNQYTMNHDSYLFYKGANNQLAASGKIFDPVTAQLYGNMKCVNNPSKTVLGLFEVSSVIKQAFVVRNIPTDNSIIITKTHYIDFPNTRSAEYKVWDGNPMAKPDDPTFNYIPVPDWWYHN